MPPGKTGKRYSNGYIGDGGGGGSHPPHQGDGIEGGYPPPTRQGRCQHGGAGRVQAPYALKEEGMAFLFTHSGSNSFDCYAYLADCSSKGNGYAQNRAHPPSNFGK
ncbi:hypothetical protein Cenrod_1979 [Candidatus Symbiobacter mobilis CR]|uniref:Uncharacterized protein n=1 Tax=Candidatus Symbiobacter mobilis CR TaxID=946483 RepID=U5NCT7_9BURK|nr:hypothetical protein Cenrod_1979 [Candidatus Symbiobacter mobilis CR]